MVTVLELNGQARSRQDRLREPDLSEPIKALDALVKSFSFDHIERTIAAEGKPAVWGGTSWDSPLVYACDTIPVAINQLWAKESFEAESVAETYFQIPSEFCSMIKSMAGRLHLRRRQGIKRILYFGSICEPIASVYEVVRSDGYDLFMVDTATVFKPEDKRPETVAFLVNELRKAAHWLTGKPVDEDRLREEIARKNTVLGKIRRLLDLRVKSPHYLRAYDMMKILAGTSHYYGNPTKFIGVLDDLIEQFEIAAHFPTPFHIPLVLAGGGLGGGGDILFRTIEESNGAFVGFLSLGTADYRVDVPPLEALVHYVLDAQASGELGESVGSSATLRRFNLERLVRRTGARGIIGAGVTGCPYASLVQQTERDHFKSLGVPFLGLEHSVHREPPTEEQVMRVKAFIEMLT